MLKKFYDHFKSGLKNKFMPFLSRYSWSRRFLHLVPGYDFPMERLIRVLKGEENVPPAVLEIHPTERCNLLCLFCVQRVQTHNYDEELNPDQLLSIVEQAKRLGVKECIVSGGGEPFASRSKTIPLLEAIKQHKMKGILITNGTMLSFEDCQLLVSTGWDQVNFSLDSPIEETHDLLRGVKGAYKKIVETIDKINQLKLKWKRSKPVLKINAVLNRENFRHIPEFFVFAEKFGFDEVSFEPLFAINPEGQRLKLDYSLQKEFSFIYQKGMHLLSILKIKSNLAGYENFLLIDKTMSMDEVHLATPLEMNKDETQPLFNRHCQRISDFQRDFLNCPCYSPWYYIRICADGRAGPCCIVSDEEAGNAKQESLEKIWQGEGFKQIRRSLLSQKLPERCRRCAASQVLYNKEFRNKLSLFK